MSDKTKKAAQGPTRPELEAVLQTLPGDYTDADYVVEGMRQHFGTLFTSEDEAEVREKVKAPPPPSTGGSSTDQAQGAGQAAATPAPTPAAAAPGVITPTQGRVVWFWREGIDRSTVQPEAAEVCYVHNDRLVNLSVTEHNGSHRSETEVVLRQPGDEGDFGRHCEWMPYQKGQAAKTEALEARK